MAQVAFDTLEATEKLETSGLSTEQARAISHIVRKIYEEANIATKADIAEVNRDMNGVYKNMESRVEHVEHEVAQVATKIDVTDVRKDMESRFERVEHKVAEVATKADIAEVKCEIADVRKEITDVRKDISFIEKRLDFSEKRFDRFERKFDRLQWFLIAGVIGILFKDVIPKLWGA